MFWYGESLRQRENGNDNEYKFVVANSVLLDLQVTFAIRFIWLSLTRLDIRVT